MNASAELQIECISMEGFESYDYNQKLRLTEQGLSACVLLAVGYRQNEDSSQNSIKVRKSIVSVVEERKYIWEEYNYLQ